MGRRVDHADLVAGVLGEPEVAVGPRGDPEGVALAVGMGNSVMTWVVGLIVPILLAPYSVNQRLPSGPAVIPSGTAVAVGSVKSVVAWVVGLIMPTLSALISVNQRLPSEPGRYIRRCCGGRGRGELGDARGAEQLTRLE